MMLPVYPVASAAVAAAEDLHSTDVRVRLEDEDDPVMMLPVYPVASADDLRDSVSESRLDLMPVVRVIKTRAFLQPKENTLIDEGLGRHLQTVVGGSHTAITAIAAVRTTVLFLVRVYDIALDNKVSMGPELSILLFFVRLICDSTLFSSLTGLLVKYPQSPSTLASHLYTMLKAIKWLSFHELSLNEPNFQPGMYRVSDLMSDCINGAKRSASSNQRKKDMTVSKAVFDGVLPPGKLI